MSRHYKRKKLNLHVKREFQKWLFIRILGVILLSSLVAAIILYLYARQEVGQSFYSAHITIRRVSDLLLPVVVAGAFVSLVSGILLALFLPQKIAGPLYRLEKTLEAVKKGDLTVSCRLRREDSLILREFADTVNETIRMLQDKIQHVKDVQSRIQECSDQDLKCVRQYAAECQKELDRLRT